MRTYLSWSEIGRLSLLFLGVGLLEFSYKYLDYVTNGRSINLLSPLLDQLTGVFAVLPLYLYWIRPLVLRHRPDRSTSLLWVPIHIKGLLVFSVLHTLMNWGSRALIAPLIGLGPYNYGRMPIRFLMEFPSDVIGYSISVAITIALARSFEAREHELRISRLESDLSKAHLDALSIQLQPHFLFNALNAVSAAIYEDPRKADIMLSRVADFLRRMLQCPASQEVALEQEIEMLNLYLEVMKARFEDGLRVDVRIHRDLRDAAVPQLILQPIVENAIRHGVEPDTLTVSVEVGAESVNGTLVLSVRDHGRGLLPQTGAGIGLSNTRSRLQRLYGDEASVSLANASDGGTEVRIELPWRRMQPA